MIKTFSVVVALLTFSACGPVGGTECEVENEGKWACEGEKTVLVCGAAIGPVGPRRQWVSYPCPGGCETRPGPWVQCTFTGAQEGDPCPRSGLGFCANSTSMLSCAHGNWTAIPCSSCTTSTGSDGFPQSLCAAP